MTLEHEESGTGGIKLKPGTGESQPPLAGEPGEGPSLELEEEPGERVAQRGSLPLHPAVIRLPFSILGRIGTELTQYPGFTFTERELQDLADLWVQTGVEMPPMMQAAIGSTAMIGGKALGYFAWVKAGKPPIHITAAGEPIWKSEEATE